VGRLDHVVVDADDLRDFHAFTPAAAAIAVHAT
jgi:hypothetical protein